MEALGGDASMPVAWWVWIIAGFVLYHYIHDCLEKIKSLTRENERLREEIATFRAHVPQKRYKIHA